MHTPKVNGVFCTPLLKVQIPFVVTSLRSETEHGTIAPRGYTSVFDFCLKALRTLFLTWLNAVAA